MLGQVEQVLQRAVLVFLHGERPKFDGWRAVPAKAQLRCKRQRFEQVERPSSRSLERAGQSPIQRGSEFLKQAVLRGRSEQIGVGDQHLTVDQAAPRGERKRGLPKAPRGDNDHVLAATQIAYERLDLSDSIREVRA